VTSATESSIEPREGEVKERGEGDPNEIRGPEERGGAVEVGEAELENAKSGPENGDFEEGVRRRWVRILDPKVAAEVAS
jgi:hypothetical protein